MNTLLKILLGTTLLAAFGTTMAKCPSNLNADEMYRCIVVEGAGDEYVAPTQKTAATEDNTQAPASSQRDSKQSDDVNLAHNNNNH